MKGCRWGYVSETQQLCLLHGDGCHPHNHFPRSPPSACVSTPHHARCFMQYIPHRFSSLWCPLITFYSMLHFFYASWRGRQESSYAPAYSPRCTEVCGVIFVDDHLRYLWPMSTAICNSFCTSRWCVLQSLYLSIACCICLKYKQGCMIK